MKTVRLKVLAIGVRRLVTNQFSDKPVPFSAVKVLEAMYPERTLME